MFREIKVLCIIQTDFQGHFMVEYSGVHILTIFYFVQSQAATSSFTLLEIYDSS